MREGGCTPSAGGWGSIDKLLEFECATGGTHASREARLCGEEYLLERQLFRRLSTSEVAEAEFLELTYPWRWRYDVLRALSYFRNASALTEAPPDERLGEAVEIVRSKRVDNGSWPLEFLPAGRVWFHLDPVVGDPSRWVTLHALRVLRWWDRHSG